MSVPGVLVPHGRLPAYAERAARPSRRPAGRMLGVLVALALGAMAVVGVVVPQVPELARTIGLAPAAPAPAPVPLVTVTAVVTATASCVSAEPHDRVVVDVAGGPHPAALDGCGRPPGTTVPVVVPADGHVTGPVTVAGSGVQTPTASTDVAGQGVSPLVARLELALAVAAALGAGALLVVVARGDTRRTVAGTRPGTTSHATGRERDRRRRPATPRCGAGPHAVRPTRVRATRSATAASARRRAPARRRR